VDTDNTQEPQEISSEEEAELEKFVLSLLEDQPAEATRGPLDLLANVLTGMPAGAGTAPANAPEIAPAETEAGAVDESRMDLAELLDSPDVVSNLAKLLQEKIKIPAIVAVPMAEYILKSLKKKKTRRKPRKTAASTAKKKTTARKKTSTTAKKKPAAKKQAATAKKPTAAAKKKTTAKKTTTKKKASAAKKPTAAAKKKTAAKKQAATAKKSTAKKKPSSSRAETVDVAET
jgi:hypothetical protein